MISNKLKKLYLVTMLLIAAHGIEEYLSGFFYWKQLIKDWRNV